MTLVEWMEQKRRSLDVSDRQFAKIIGADPSLISLLRNNKRRPGLGLMQRLIAAFPADREAIFSCAFVVPTGTRPISVVTDALAS